MTAQVRAQRNAVELLRAIATPKRPLVVFVDDLQWAGRTPLGLFDLALSEEPIDGLLLVGAYREGDVDVAHPLAALLSRADDEAAVEHLRLANLPVPSLVTMVAETLHVERDAATGLVEAIQRQTSGNPYETVELLNALRRDGLVMATRSGVTRERRPASPNISTTSGCVWRMRLIAISVASKRATGSSTTSTRSS